MASSRSAETSELAAVIERAWTAVQQHTGARYSASWRYPDGSVSTEGFDLESWSDVLERSSSPSELPPPPPLRSLTELRPVPAATPKPPQPQARSPVDPSTVPRHLLVLRDTTAQGAEEQLAGYAKLKLVSEWALGRREVEAAAAALAAGGGGGLGGGIAYLGCVVTLDEYQGGGVGTLLCLLCMRRALELRCRFLIAHAMHPAMRRALTRLGWAEPPPPTMTTMRAPTPTPTPTPTPGSSLVGSGAR
eukprot:COSAG01_NODE_17790_length_1124_cov_1.100488_1_plen_247_part_01